MIRKRAINSTFIVNTYFKIYVNHFKIKITTLAFGRTVIVIQDNENELTLKETIEEKK